MLLKTLYLVFHHLQSFALQQVLHYRATAKIVLAGKKSLAVKYPVGRKVLQAQTIF